MAQRPTSVTLARFLGIPPLMREVWQGTVIRLPIWIHEGAPDKRPWRPWGVIWASGTTGRIGTEMQQEWSASPDVAALALDALLSFAQQEIKQKVLNGRAARLQVTHAWLAERLAPLFAETDVHIEVTENPPALRQALDSMYEHAFTKEQAGPPGALTGEGVTAELMRGFAEAAAQFFNAAPWTRLQDLDPIVVESPAAPDGLRVSAVMGSGGVAFGLAFYRDESVLAQVLDGVPAEELLEAGPARSIMFSFPEETAFGDHDLWLDEHLPLARPDAFPFFAVYERGTTVTRPTAAEVSFAEAVLRAIALATEEELDAGRWTKEVSAGGRTVAVTLTLPEVLKAHRVFEHLAAEGGDPHEQARDLAQSAFEFGGRVQLLMLRRALELWPDCIEAHDALASRCNDLLESLASLGETPYPDVLRSMREALEREEQHHLQAALDSGRRLLGPRFDALRGRLSEDDDGERYLTVMRELAATLDARGQRDAALAAYREMIALDRDDAVGARESLAALLLLDGRDDEARELFAQFPEDDSLASEWARVLWTYRQVGDVPEARAVLLAAVARNRFVPDMLQNPSRVMQVMQEETRESDQGPESQWEAVRVAFIMAEVWDETPGAYRWLRERIGGPKRSKRATRSRRRR